MKNVFVLLVLTILIFPERCEAKPFSFFYSDSLISSDSTTAKNYMIKADSLFEAGQFDSAIVYFEKAAVIFEKTEDWENYIYCLSRKGRCFFKMGEITTAIKIYGDTKTIILEKLSEKHISMVRILYYLSGAHWRLSEYDIARKYIEDAIILSKYFEKENDLEVTDIISRIYNSLGLIDFEEGKYDDALYNVRQAIEISKEYTDEIPVSLGNYNNILAVIYTEKGNNDKAIYYYEQALNIYKNAKLENHPNIGLIYQNIAVLKSESNGDYDEALVYLEKAQSILLDNYGEEHFFVAMVYYNKGDIYFKKGDFDKSLFFYDKALNSYKSVFNTEEHTDVAMTYNSIGEVYESKSNYDKAYEYYQNALSIRLSLFGEQHADVAENYNNIGAIKRIQKKYEEAIKYHEDALTILKQTYGEWHPEIAQCYNLLGLVYRENRKFDISLQNFQNAIMANVPSYSNEDLKSSPILHWILSEPRLLESLSYKAETLSLCFEEQNDTAMLITAFDTYESIVDLIDKMRNGHKAEGSKLFLAEKSSKIFAEAIKTSIQLLDITEDINYKYKAYLFCENSKARILQEAVNESRARNFSGIPDSLLTKENQLKVDLTFYENQLQSEKYRTDNIDSLKIRELENRLFGLNLEYQQLVEQLELNFTKYYRSKYSNNTFEIEEVQASLANNEALLEYFIGKDAINLFCISKNDYELITIDIDDQFEELISSFYSSIKKIEKMEYLKFANQLYELLFKPVEHFLADKQKLIIIPDGQLYYVPFEALITEVNTRDKKDFTKQNYLINKYEITYNYSTSFLVSTSNNRVNDTFDNGFIGFAPVFNSQKVGNKKEGNSGSTDSLNTEDVEYRFFSGDKIRELPYSEDELKYIINLFQDKNLPASGYFYDDASKENFKSDAGHHQFIHLATHSFVNPEKPQFSGIIFSQPEDSTSSDGTIYSNEIYNLDLNADLVVLSSCESGIGKLVKGEGMMALTRGFLYAGAENIITSLWKVLDKSTSELMKNFYKNVLDDASYSDALRKAKLELINDKKTAFPINWSGFVLIGR